MGKNEQTNKQTNKNVQHVPDGYNNCSWCSLNDPQRLANDSKTLVKLQKNREPLYYNNVKMSQYIGKNT